ncbi:MAG: zf-HC2 domain-containing protein [Actinomycetota bacterium]|nr:zf-HC2 domain-containing protein [Actinomycetota bacterium]
MSQERQIACQEFVEEVTDYLEGKLSEVEERWTDEHLAACPHCRAYLEQMRATIAALRGLAETDVDPALRDRILSSLP